MWRKNQALIVPTMLSSSISVLSQSIFVIFGMILVVYLESSGGLSRLAFFASRAQYSNLLSLLFSKPVIFPIILLLGMAAVVSVLVAILANGFALSAEYVSYRRALERRHVSIGEAIYAIRDKWRAMAWTSFLTLFVTYLPLGLGSLAVIYSLYTSSGNLFAVLGTFFLLFLGGIISLLLEFFFMYSTISVALDDLSGFKAMKRSFHRTTGNFGVSITYALVRVGLYLLLSGVALLSQFITLPLSSLVSIMLTILLVPVLHLTKTSIFRQMSVPVSYSELGATSATQTTALHDLFRGPYARYILSTLSKGLGVLKNFVFAKNNAIYHLCSALAFLFGVLAGSYIAVHGLTSAIFALGYQEGQINPTILKAVPLSEGFDIFFHNWTVSLATGLSGIWFVAPSLVTLGFNGVILGIVYYLTPNATMFAAAIFPHGVIELPSLIIAGSTGMKLGVAFLRAHGFSLAKGKEGESAIDPAKVESFHRVARETIYVLVGLAVLFLIAGFIEGNITPVIMRAVGFR
jgi:uncharacterized membrane protein SpoIIM required for sporulation